MFRSLSFKGIPFGLCNAGATFQRIMEIVLNKFLNFLAFIDDILTFSKIFDEHLVHLEALFKRLCEVNIKVKTTKWRIAQSTKHFLGYKISENSKIKLSLDLSYRIKLSISYKKKTFKEYILQQVFDCLWWERNFSFKP